MATYQHQHQDSQPDAVDSDTTNVDAWGDIFDVDSNQSANYQHEINKLSTNQRQTNDVDWDIVGGGNGRVDTPPKHDLQLQIINDEQIDDYTPGGTIADISNLHEPMPQGVSSDYTIGSFLRITEMQSNHVPSKENQLPRAAEIEALQEQLKRVRSSISTYKNRLRNWDKTLGMTADERANFKAQVCTPATYNEVMPRLEQQAEEIANQIKIMQEEA